MARGLSVVQCSFIYLSVFVCRYQTALDTVDGGECLFCLVNASQFCHSD